MKRLVRSISSKIKSLASRGASLAMASILLSGLLLSTMPAAKATAAPVQNLKATPRVSFTFDDGLANTLTQAAPILAAHSLTATDYVISGCVGMTTAPNTCAADGTASYMTWDQIAQLKAQNWEIASHTVSHMQLSTDKPTAAKLTSELKDSQAALVAHGYAATDLAFPYGDYDSNVLAQTAKYYESARGFADLGYNTWPYDSTLVVNQQIQEGATVGATVGVTYDQVKAYVDTAIANNQWLVLTFHNVIPTKPANLQADAYATSTALLDQIAAYVKQQQDAGKIKAVNVEDGLVRGTNMLPNGDFAQGIAAGWTTDDAVNITADANNNGRYPEPTHSISLKSTATATTDAHLFSPQVAVSSTGSYIIKNYVNLLKGGEVDFFIDEYGADGNYLSGKYFNGMAYNTAANAINTRDINFLYTPSSATVVKARLQVIVHGANVSGYLDGSQWLDANEVAGGGTTTPPTTTLGDLDGNGVVNGIDLSTLLGNWNTTTPSTTHVLGDLDGNGLVNGIDLSTLLGNWSK